MPNLTIQGKKYSRILNAKVEIDHGKDAKEAVQVPTMQFRIQLPLDDDPDIANWALQPYGDKRFAKVELQTLDRSGVTNHTWTLQKAYVHRYEEVEFAPGSGSETDQGNYYEIVVRGTLLNNEAYNGKNVLDVAKGDKEKLPGA